ncbi:hypothetical protein ONS95_010003 [Cadophora gregata]|uniref:uncharacterized protein n=1 Tax=Cadophora gregata TaxID=51156 RepID=UPI0026DD9113|nr:uncharacterized protein ONS95_010003 [Cadophora gregata]KAK0121717.1 hypothetical protein ONS95_010003 [Cadophora gregata]KAK0127193.1 hypothetical protein ONS96_006746 [Cadophora gregata f. sp. sojae]
MNRVLENMLIIDQPKQYFGDARGVPRHPQIPFQLHLALHILCLFAGNTQSCKRPVYLKQLYSSQTEAKVRVDVLTYIFALILMTFDIFMLLDKRSRCLGGLWEHL